ncbi:MAG: hypothetical protein C0601_12055 [Candidatus Muiribacterium halophilum]|uniref:Damage-control phosphatase ARMT1-like metal-binding domain-containing protein n=1 Tax=Muiribacterium halophilum TaxID=2053465 RepID=A0A2N5ZAW2_MUIH1|nr:MAG: hypothetical protein C0601_12055 [Candidatus Muirbacterium halophilum]
MRTFPECVPCLMSQMLYALEKTSLMKDEKNEFYYRWVKEIAKNVPQTTPMELATSLHKEIRDLSGEDPYKEIKELSTKLLKKNERLIRSHYKRSQELSDILSLVICGNLIDIKSHAELGRLNMEAILEKGLSKKFAIDHSETFKKRIEDANNILYLGDNAGEIYFDKYFVKWLQEKGKKVYFVVRGDNILNDATLKEAKECNIEDYCFKVINNGHHAPGTMIKECSEEFKKIYKKADLVISKGQGNLETLIDNREKDIFFLLLTKCPAISNLLGTKIKDAVIVYNMKLETE